MSHTLKPCPFCGGAASFWASESGFTASLRVGCDSCGAATGRVTYSTRENGLTEEKDPIPPQRWKDAAAKQWNKRAAPPAPARQEPLTEAQIERAAHAIDYEAAFVAGFYEGARFAERAHGITAAPAEGGAA